MIVIGVIGISLSSIFVKYSDAPSAVTAAYRLLWTVILMSPVVFGKREVREELLHIDKKALVLSGLSGVFFAIHFVLWFESLFHTSVASSTTIVCTEVIWVSLGFCLFMKGKLSAKAIGAIAVTFIGSILIAYADSATGGLHLYGDMLALLAAIAVAVYMLLGRVVRETVSTTVYTYMVYAACAAVLMVICVVQGHGFVELSHVVHENGYREMDAEELREMFSSKAGNRTYEDYMKPFCERKYNSEFSREMTRSVGKYLEDFLK